jgi:hypothetical protein
MYLPADSRLLAEALNRARTSAESDKDGYWEQYLAAREDVLRVGRQPSSSLNGLLLSTRELLQL